MTAAVLSVVGLLTAQLVLAQGGEAGACATGGAVPDASNNPGLVSDCEALLASRDTLAGEAALNWSADRLIAKWQGVTVGGTPERVTKLSLDNGLEGTIPAELGSLSNLTTLWLSGNRLMGDIPAELGSLSNLTWLGIHDNQLTGGIPVELGSLSNLTTLSLGSNRLTGAIPAELGSLTNLQQLWLGNNQLTGAIPAELGSLSNLTELRLSVNQLTGAIPAELGSLVNLTTLMLGGNQLTGCIPAGLRRAVNNDLDDLGLLFCDVLLTGLTISPRALSPSFDPYETSYTASEGPTSVTVTASNIHGADIRFLDESGAGIEDGDAELDGLQVDLEGGITTIRVEVTSSDGESVRVYSIWVWSNPESACVSGRAVEDGANAALVWDCEALLAARDTLAGSGTLNWKAEIPMAWWTGVMVTGTPQRVTEVDLYYGGLAGSIPAEIGSLTGLRRLYLNDNRLTGSIPAELGRLSDLTTLELHDNQLEGIIPAELGSLAKLTTLYLNDNRLEGEIPAELGNLTGLEQLSLNNNRLTSTIPSELGSLVDLRRLDLSANRLEGGIPAELGSLPRLYELRLDRNQLAGTIPPDLGKLISLGWLHLNGNRLTGTIPPRSAIWPTSRGWISARMN